MNIHFLRHATFVLEIAGLRLLVDPMLSPAGAMDPVQNAADTRRIPLVDLPLDEAGLRELLNSLDGVLVTHTHRDHWDARAIELLPKGLPILCQPEDEAKIASASFTQALPVAAERAWRALKVTRTGGRHGTGEIGQKMGPVSGFVITAPDEPRLYVVGDSIWCPEVAAALAAHTPQAVVVNAGAAQFLTGDPITMTAADVIAVCRAAPGAGLVAVHMETVNHCGLTRPLLRQALAGAGLEGRVQIPADGAQVRF
jgi:L-ascorbate metabolism protein UlaG (beta-lactamase superfamily)